MTRRWRERETKNALSNMTPLCVCAHIYFGVFEVTLAHFCLSKSGWQESDFKCRFAEQNWDSSIKTDTKIMLPKSFRAQESSACLDSGVCEWARIRHTTCSKSSEKRSINNARKRGLKQDECCCISLSHFCISLAQTTLRRRTRTDGTTGPLTQHTEENIAWSMCQIHKENK